MMLTSQQAPKQASPTACQPGLMSWTTVPDFIQAALKTRGCTLLRHQRQRPQLKHIRFQYAPFAYQDNLYYLQKWSRDEWGVSPSQIIFPAEGACPFELLSNGSLLATVVKKAVAKFYGHFPDDFSLQLSSAGRRSINGQMLPLAG